MKKLIVLLFILVTAFSLNAQTSQPLNAMSLNGATGIFVVPTARVAYSEDDMGFNVGYHTNLFKPGDNSAKVNHLLQVNFGFFRMLEVSGTFDIQPKNLGVSEPDDLIIGAKFQLPIGSMPIALGANFQALNFNDDTYDHTAFQIYAAITYRSDLFGWPADTTLVIGHTFRENVNHSNIDFGMGFDLIIFPSVAGNFVHFLMDFANFSYSNDPWGADASSRGVLNTGLRLDLSQIPSLNRFTFALDVFLVDAFDSSRSFGIGVCFGSRF